MIMLPVCKSKNAVPVRRVLLWGRIFFYTNTRARPPGARAVKGL